jgi:hypothetical protein
MAKWLIGPLILLLFIFVGWFMYKISKIANEFFQWARIVDGKVDKIETFGDYYDALKAYHKLIHLDTLGKGHADIMRLKGRLEEKFKQLNDEKNKRK